MNRAILIGNLCKNPDLRTTNSGVSVCRFTVATQRRFKNQDGEREADFIPVVVWRDLADLCAKYLTKGRKVGVSGHIQTRNYEANDGSKRTMTEVVADEVEFLTAKGSSDTGSQQPPGTFEGDYGELIDDSSLPF